MGKQSNGVVSGMFWKFTERILAQFISFVVSIVLARMMLPEQYAIIAMVIIFINIANVFVTSGFSTSLIQKKDATERDFSTIFWCTLVVSVIIYAVLFVTSPLIAGFYEEPLLIPVIRVFSLKILISAVNSIQHAYVSRHMIFKKFFISTLFGTLISGVVGIIMAYYGFGVWALVAQYLVNSTIDTLVLLITVPWRPRFQFAWDSAKKLMSFGWKVLVADLIGTIYDNLRQLFIGKVYTPSQLAFYNKGKQIPELITTNIDTTVSSVLFPAISNVSGNRDEVYALTRRTMRISSYVIFPLMFGLISIAKPLIVLLLTENWIGSVFFLQVIAIAKAVNTITNVNLQSIKAVGRSDIVLKLELVKKPVGVLIIIVSVQLGIKAVAWSMLVYALYAMLVNMSPNSKILGYGLLDQLKDILPAVLLSATMAGFVMLVTRFLHNNLVIVLVGVVAGALFYVGTSYLLKLDSFQYLLDFAKRFLKKNKQAAPTK